MALIEISNLSYSYPISEKQVLKNINLSLEKGKFYAVVGENGSGKTTLCNVIRGFVPHFYKGDLEGSIEVDGKNLLDADLGSIALNIGYIFQNPFNQISGIRETVYEELAYGLENMGVAREEIKERVEKTIDLLNLSELADKNPMELSGGQQQRVAFASVLIMDTDILVIDEPTSQLDPQATESIFEIIEHIKNEGKTVILVEHKIELIAKFADEIIVLHHGEIKTKGPTKEVLTDVRLEEWGVPYTEYTKLAKALQQEKFSIEKLPIGYEETVGLINNLKK